jgi:hypothetical protein
LIDQVDRQAVHLELTQVAGLFEPLLAKLANRTLGPAIQLLTTERVVQAHQPLQMLDRSEGG